MGEDQAADPGAGRLGAGLAAVEVEVRDVLLAVGEGGLAEKRSVPSASSCSASQVPVSPEYVSERPPCSTRMPYASTGWHTFSVRTENGPSSKAPDFSVWKSKTSPIAVGDGVSAYAVVSRCSAPSGAKTGIASQRPPSCR